MDDKELVETNSTGFFSKIKLWFLKLFYGNNKNVENLNNDLELEKQQINYNDDVIEDYENTPNKLKYEFSTPTVSKQKLDKIKIDLDSGKIGFEKLYELSNNEINELGKLYDTNIIDMVSKLREVEMSLNNYRRKLSKIQNQ